LLAVDPVVLALAFRDLAVVERHFAHLVHIPIQPSPLHGPE
jgi:hypothetical protein